MELPTLNKDDVEFGYLTVLHYFANMEEIVENYVFNSRDEREAVKLLGIIKMSEEGISRTDLYKKTRSISKRVRENIIQDLADTEEIFVEQVQKDGRPTTIFKAR
jgi:hypothetical protein